LALPLLRDRSTRSWEALMSDPIRWPDSTPAADDPDPGEAGPRGRMPLSLMSSANRSRRIDRRQAKRYRIDLPVELPAGSGLTRNVSESGVLFETTAHFSAGELVPFSLVFGHVVPREQSRVECVGRVVRVEDEADTSLVAVELRSYGLPS
jgi:hypothetical protein